MKLHQRFRPITFFIVGLLLGLGYLGASYIMHMTVLQKAGDRVSERVAEYKRWKKQYGEDQERIQELSNLVETEYDKLKAKNKSYQAHFKSFQQLITEIAQVGKQHNLTFLYYRAEPSQALKEIPGERVFTSSLSLGGSFKNIHTFLEVIKDHSDPQLPLSSVEVIASSERNTQIKLIFKYVGELDSFLKGVQKAEGETTHSFLVLDPWTMDI